MGWTVFQVAIAVVMVVTGSINTLSTKWANTSKGEDSQGKLEYFNHPFLQCSGMFLGEILCMIAFYVHKYWIARTDVDADTLPFNPLILAPAGLCDLIATSTMYVGLTITYASSFQMLRGAVIIFTGILSRILLKSKLKWFNWTGMVIIMGGLLIVGASDLINEGSNKGCHNLTTTTAIPNTTTVTTTLPTTTTTLKTSTTSLPTTTTTLKTSTTNLPTTITTLKISTTSLPTTTTTWTTSTTATTTTTRTTFTTTLISTTSNTPSTVIFANPINFYNTSHFSLDEPSYSIAQPHLVLPKEKSNQNKLVCDKICWRTATRNVQQEGEEGKCEENDNASNPLVGDILIICAQIVVACQMVYEQKFISKYNIPALKVVGWEGIFGFTTIVLLMIPMYFIKVGKDFGHGPEYRLEDAIDGLIQLTHSWKIALATCGNIFSIAFFNFAGVSVTKELSATTRMVLDSVRTLVVWVFSILPFIAWQQFYFLQPIGFVVLIGGMFLYNDVIIVPFIRKYILKNDLASGYATIE